MIERIAEQLGSPERCPHGWPVDTDFEQAENRELVALADLEPGHARRSCGSPSTTATSSTGTTTRGSSRDPSSCEPPSRAGQFTSRQRRGAAIDEKAAAGLFVRTSRLGWFEVHVRRW